MKSQTPRAAVNTILRHGFTVEQARKLSDAELAKWPGFGAGCIAWLRSLPPEVFDRE